MRSGIRASLAASPVTALATRTGAAPGIGAGLLVHTFAAAVGLSALLAASAAAFTILKWIGAALQEQIPG